LGFFVNGYFPLFPWLIYPLVGMAVRELLPRAKSWQLPVIGMSLMVLAFLGTNFSQTFESFLRGYAVPLEFYPASTTFIFGTLGVILLLFWILHRWLDSASSETGPIMASFHQYSRFSLTVYAVHHAVHLWPIYLADGIQGRSLWYYYAGAASTPVAFSLSLVFIVVFYGVSVWWEKSGGKYSLEWLLAQLTK